MRIPPATFVCFLLLNLAFAQQQGLQCPPLLEGGVFTSAPPASAPQPVYTPQPEYPSSLKRAKPIIEGTSLLRAKVDKQGRVSEVNVTRSLDHRLDQSAIDTVKRWKFTPAMRDGKPVEVCISVKVDFRQD